MTLNPNEFSRLHGKLGTDGGFTVNPRTGADITSGISVAPHGNELRVPAAQTSPADLSSFHGRADNQARFDRGAAFGGWRQDTTQDDFVDTPAVYPNTPGGNAVARHRMIKNKQIAGFRLDDYAELINPHHPDNKSQDISTSDDSPETKKAWTRMPLRVTGGKKVTPTEGMSFS